MSKIDAHNHFWKFQSECDTWITAEMNVLKKDFLPEDLESLLKHNGFHGCVAVQSCQQEQENFFYLKLAEKYDFIKGIVGWVDLQRKDISDSLAYFSQFNKIKGFRHIFQDESERALMLNRNFLRGIKALNDLDFTYDILVFPDQLPYVKELIEKFPQQRFVIDHIGKPNIKSGQAKVWRKLMKTISAYDNVFCKISGMVTEANWGKWNNSNFRTYIDIIVEDIGVDRLLFGSDWPVCLLAATYDEVAELTGNYFSSFTKNEQELIFGKNALSFYRLKELTVAK